MYRGWHTGEEQHLWPDARRAQSETQTGQHALGGQAQKGARWRMDTVRLPEEGIQPPCLQRGCMHVSLDQSCQPKCFGANCCVLNVQVVQAVNGGRKGICHLSGVHRKLKATNHCRPDACKPLLAVSMGPFLQFYSYNAKAHKLDLVGHKRTDSEYHQMQFNDRCELAVADRHEGAVMFKADLGHHPAADDSSLQNCAVRVLSHSQDRQPATSCLALPSQVARTDPCRVPSQACALRNRVCSTTSGFLNILAFRFLSCI